MPRFTLRTLVLAVLTLGLLGYLNFIPTEVRPALTDDFYKVYGFPYTIYVDQRVIPELTGTTNAGGHWVSEGTGFVNIAREWRLPDWTRMLINAAFAFGVLALIAYISEKYQHRKEAQLFAENPA